MNGAGFRRMLVLVALTVTVGGAVFVDAADDPFNGTWKLNLAKSKLAPPLPRSVIGVFKSDGHSLTERVEATDTEGRTSTASVTAAFDGKFYPLVGSPLADSVRYERLDSHTIRGTSRKDGKILVTEMVKLSPDGKTMTVTYSGNDAQGKPVTGTAVFEKIAGGRPTSGAVSSNR